MGIGRILREDLAFPCPRLIVFQPFPYGFKVDTKLTLDSQLAPAHAVQSYDLIKKSTPILMPVLLLPCREFMERLFFHSLAAYSIIRIDLRHKRLPDIADKAVSPLHDILQGIGTITQKMPTIGYLLCFRRSVPGSTRIRASPIPGDDFNTRMVRKPSRERFLLPIGQQIDNVVRFQIDQDRSVTLSAPPSPIVDAENSRPLAIASGICSPRNPQNSVGAHRHAEAGDKPRACFSPQRHADAAMDILQTPGAPTIAPSHVAKVLGKYTPTASLVAATQAPDIQGYRDRTPLPW